MDSLLRNNSLTPGLHIYKNCIHVHTCTHTYIGARDTEIDK